jgi:hypothetical protein
MNFSLNVIPCEDVFNQNAYHFESKIEEKEIELEESPQKAKKRVSSPISIKLSNNTPAHRDLMKDKQQVKQSKKNLQKL